MNDQDKAVWCEICNLWFHTCCQSVPEDLYNAITKTNLPSLHWFCERCNRAASGLLSNITAISHRQSAMEESLEQVQNKMESLNTVVNQTNAQVSVLEVRRE